MSSPLSALSELYIKYYETINLLNNKRYKPFILFKIIPVFLMTRSFYLMAPIDKQKIR